MGSQLGMAGEVADRMTDEFEEFEPIETALLNDRVMQKKRSSSYGCFSFLL